MTGVQWQPPKWALNAAMKDPVKDYVPVIFEEEKLTAKETIAAIMSGTTPALGTSAGTTAKASVMDIFSPVNKSTKNILIIGNPP